MNQLNSSSTGEQVPAKGTTAAVTKVLRISSILFGGHIAGIVFLLFVALQAGSWQIYAMTGVLIVTGVIYFAALQMMRRGRLESGGWLLLAAVMAAILIGPFLIAGSGVILGIVSVAVAYLISSQTLPSKVIRPILYGSIVIGLLVALTDFLDLTYRLNVPALRAFTPVLVTVILLIAAFFVVREAWSRSLTISRKLYIGFGALGLLALVVGGVSNLGLNRVQKSYDTALAEGEELELISLHMSNDLALARGLAKDFLLHWKELGYETAYKTYIVPHDAAMAELREHVEGLPAYRSAIARELPKTYPVTFFNTGLVLMNQDLDKYQEEMQLLLKVVQERGFEDTGLEGEFRVAVHNIEDRILDRPGLESLTITMLQLRRHEKDFLLRGDQEYMDLVHERVRELKDQVNASDQLSVQEKTELRALADQYLVAFDALAEKETELAAITHELDLIELQMAPQADDFASAGARLAYLEVSAAQTNSTQTLLYSSITLVVALFFAAFLSTVMSRQIANPVVALTNTAGEIAGGRFDVRADVFSGDEIGTLAQSFNTMTERLGQAFEDVRRRAAELATVAEVSTATSTILDARILLQEVVDLTKERFNLYHSHIYLLDEKGENLVLASGAGEAGHQMVTEGRSIPLDREQSLVARAARERNGVTVNDVTQAPDFLPNPLLPETRSELAVPMMVAGKVIGVFDVQSDVVGRFTNSDINIQTTLAAQVATSIQNVRSFEQSKKQADFEAMVNVIGQRIQRTTSIEETLQTAIRELGTAVGASRVKANISARKDGSNN